MAALQAVAFYRAATRKIQPTWLATAVPDGRRPRLQKLTAWGVAKMLAAAETDPGLSEKIFRAGQFIDTPSVRQGSSVAARLLAVYLPRPRRRAPSSARSGRRTPQPTR